MNHIYKLKFDARRNALVAVSELTTGAGKTPSGQIDAPEHARAAETVSARGRSPHIATLGAIAGVLALLVPLFTQASPVTPSLPAGGQVVAGQGQIQDVNHNQLSIQQGSQNMVVNWDSFDIARDHTVQFYQPNSSAVALNRVIGGHESQIMGNLNANGQVFLVNPNGVLFGKDARVNTAGLLATTADIPDAAFMKQHYRFTDTGKAGAQVINQGNLTTTPGGYIVLAGRQVDNQGTLHAPDGRVALLAGETVTLQLDSRGLTAVDVNGEVVNALVQNRGLISAADGRVYLTARGRSQLLKTVINNQGVIEARGLHRQGGDIVLDGGEQGVVRQAGTLSTHSEHGRGGKVVIQGQDILLARTGRTEATGETGGGEVYIGGGWQGKSPKIRHADKVVMQQGAQIDVSAGHVGDGGTAVLWSDNYTDFQGDIQARGGRLAGRGGRVETSSHGNLQALGQVDVHAARGQQGDWLLDPLDVEVVDNSSIGSNHANEINDSHTNADGENHIFAPGSTTHSKVLNTSLQNALTSGANVTILTNSTTAGSSAAGNITVSADIIKNKDGGNATLNLIADGNISINKNITSSNGSLNLNLQAGKTSTNANITIGNSNGNGNSVTLTTNGGYVNITSANTSHSVNILVNNHTNVTTNGGDFIVGSNKSEIQKAKGNLTFKLNGSASVINTTHSGSNSDANSNQGNVTISGYTNTDNNTIDISGNITAGNLTFDGNEASNNKSASHLDGAHLNITHAINIKGDSAKGIGTWLNNSSLHASSVDITGSSSDNVGLNISGQQVNITATSGNVTITGNSNNNVGVAINTSTHLNITGNRADSNVIITGTGKKYGLNISGNVNATNVSHLTLNASSTNDNAVYIKDGVNVTATNYTDASIGTILNITGNSSGRNGWSGVEFNGSANISAVNGSVNIDGTGGSKASGVHEGNSNNQQINITSGNISLTGKTSNGTFGIDTQNATLTLNASNNISILGTGDKNTRGSGGFSLKNLIIKGTTGENNGKGPNVSLSSAGSADDVTNTLNANMTLSELKSILQAGIDNNTQVGTTNITADGSTDSSATTSDSSSNSAAGFLNTSDHKVNLTALANLLHPNPGHDSNDNNASLTLNFTSHSRTGAWGFSNVSALSHGGDINLIGILLSNASITSASGNISIDNHGRGVSLVNTNLTAGSNHNKSITINGADTTLTNVTLNGTHITVNGTSSLSDNGITIQNLTLNSSSNGTAIFNGNSTGGGIGIYLKGENGGSYLNATNISTLTLNGSSNSAQGVLFDNNFTINTTNATTDSAGTGTTLNITGISGAKAGVEFLNSSSSSSSVNITATNGAININGTGYDNGGLHIKGNSTLTASNISLTGSSQKAGSGIWLDENSGSHNTNVTLNATHNISIKGTGNSTVSKAGGFYLDKLIITKGSGNGPNVTLSSAGSADDATNTLNANMTSGELESILKAGIENNTNVNLTNITQNSGDTTHVFNSSEKSINLTALAGLLSGANNGSSTSANDTTLTLNFTHVDSSSNKSEGEAKNGFWGFNKVANLTHGGDINLIGIMLSNTNVTSNNGSITINNGNQSVGITNTNLTANSAKSITIEGGATSLTNVTLTASNITVNATTDSSDAAITIQNLTLNGTSNGNVTFNGNNTGGGRGLYIKSGNINATNVSHLTLNGNASGASGGEGIVIDSGVTINTTNSSSSSSNPGTILNITGVSKNKAGIELTSNNVNITAQNGTVNLNGTGHDNGGIHSKASNLNITAKDINLTGTIDKSGSGIWSEKNNTITLNASGNINIAGTATNVTISRAGGFWIDHLTINNGQAGDSSSSNGPNVTLSSAGSADDASNTINKLNTSFGVLRSILKNGVENNTKINLADSHITGEDTNDNSHNSSDHINPLVDKGSNGGKLVNLTILAHDFGKNGEAEVSLDTTSSSTATTDDFNLNLTHAGKGGSWDFGKVQDLTRDGNISISGVVLNGTNITSNKGNITIGFTESNGNGTLRDEVVNSNLTANGAVNLNGGYVVITNSHITSNTSSIGINGHSNSTSWATSVNILNSTLNATQGNITLNGTNNGLYSGVRLSNVNLTANTAHGNISVYAHSKGVDDFTQERGSLYIEGINHFTAKNMIFTGNNTRSDYKGVGVLFYGGSNSTFTGNVNISGTAHAKGISFWKDPTLNFMNGTVSILGKATINGDIPATTDADYYGLGAISGDAFYGPAQLVINLTNATVNITADTTSTTTGANPAFGINNIGSAGDTNQNGIKIIGNGTVNILGKANDGNGVDSRLFDNSGLHGHLSITGESNSGTGVVYDGPLDVKLTNATIKGTSNTGIGVVVNGQSGTVNLGNNTITGTTETGTAGVSVTNNGTTNITVTNGSLTGTSTSGNGTGVTFTGATTGKFNIDGAHVEGHSVDGTGVSVNGTLDVSNKAQIIGSATGTGAGMTIAGDLKGSGSATFKGVANSGVGLQVSGDLSALSLVALTGESNSGIGVNVEGTTKLNKATVTGHTKTGTGIKVTGGLTNTDGTLAGTASAGGAGVELAGHVSGGKVSGSSTTGSGVIVSGDTQIDNVTVNGDSSSGQGIKVIGKLKNTGSSSLTGKAQAGVGVDLQGEVTGGSLTGQSDRGVGVQVSGDKASLSGTHITGNTVSGSGVLINGNLNAQNGSVVSGDATGSGNGINLAGGKVTGGQLNGHSQNGNGVTVSGNSQLDGTVLNATTTNGSAFNMPDNVTLGTAGGSKVTSSVSPGGSGKTQSGGGSPEGKLMQAAATQQAYSLQSRSLTLPPLQLGQHFLTTNTPLPLTINLKDDTGSDKSKKEKDKKKATRGEGSGGALPIIITSGENNR
ncbi:ESPR-type extended signal peptide-containing protein (plasmid) [Edwardsiella tarda]|uniref:ESPR-type extended signal peptide-containing protein n=1 Tax=Edwardsiella tarda TaxID=636 RepID=UPI002443A04B|nr:ESPR-type extended signal peptide-containing protein [Edwardsiella tarda]WGE31054.1 ESPR-type extended signal peptide-containing protein [Edwardsiella tarda]